MCWNSAPSTRQHGPRRFFERGQLLPRERLARLLDPGRPFLELMSLTGYCGLEDPATSVPGSAIIAGIGFVAGARVMLVVNDSGISAGAMQHMTSRKIMRCQEIALENRLPFIQLVESAGGNLRSYRVERFIAGGGMFRNLALLSAAGLPVLAVVHGSSTAGGAYLPGLSDYVVMVRGRARAFLAGPPLLRPPPAKSPPKKNWAAPTCMARCPDWVTTSRPTMAKRFRCCAT